MCIQPNVINKTVHKISPPHSVSSVESPDLKIVSCTDSLLTHTPAQSAPERLLLGSDVKLQKMTAQKSGSCFKPAKRVFDFTLTEGSDDLDNRVYMSKPSRGCSEEFKSFDSVSPPQEVCACYLVLVLIFDFSLKSYFDTHLLFYFVPFILCFPESLQRKQFIFLTFSSSC